MSIYKLIFFYIFLSYFILKFNLKKQNNILITNGYITKNLKNKDLFQISFYIFFFLFCIFFYNLKNTIFFKKINFKIVDTYFLRYTQPIYFKSKLVILSILLVIYLRFKLTLKFIKQYVANIRTTLNYFLKFNEPKEEIKLIDRRKKTSTIYSPLNLKEKPKKDYKFRTNNVTKNEVMLYLSKKGYDYILPIEELDNYEFYENIYEYIYYKNEYDNFKNKYLQLYDAFLSVFNEYIPKREIFLQIYIDSNSGIIKDIIFFQNYNFEKLILNPEKFNKKYEEMKTCYNTLLFQLFNILKDHPFIINYNLIVSTSNLKDELKDEAIRLNRLESNLLSITMLINEFQKIPFFKYYCQDTLYTKIINCKNLIIDAIIKSNKEINAKISAYGTESLNIDPLDYKEYNYMQFIALQKTGMYNKQYIF